MGAYLRLEQISAQVLVNDEWNPIHEILYATAWHTATSFGHADYGIPLVLIDRLLMNWFALSELALRLPMIVAGLLTLILFPLALVGRLRNRTIVLFAVLLSISPFLISYARTGRPYALTLFGVYLAFWLFERAIHDREIRWKPASGYALLCGLVVWTHAISGPMVVAPLVAQWWATVRRRGLPLNTLIAWTGLVGVMMALAVLPPLLGDPAALAGKSGIDNITLETAYGASFLWFGTGSRAVWGVALVLTLAGWGTIWRAIAMVRWATLGLIITLLALFVIRPWWVDKPLAFGRYLLPAVPLLLLAMSAGIVRIADRLSVDTGTGAWRAAWTLALALPFAAACWLTSPMPEILRRPNSYAEDSYFQYDYRTDVNEVRIGMGAMTLSPFWAGLSAAPPGSLTVAVAPFHYATYDWPAPLWEKASRQRIIPAFLWGSCSEYGAGEIPPDARFGFRNGVHLNDKSAIVAHGVDYLAYYRPPQPSRIIAPRPQCEPWVREHYGPPDYEDQTLVVWRLR
jgi:hypothetical protein